MANKKFSEFVLKTSTSDVSHIVGYNGAENVQITPANFVTTGGTGVFLPLAGGTMTGDTIHNDNVKSIFGSPGNDLQIYHDGLTSYINDSGTGDLKILTSRLEINNVANSENIATFTQNSAVELYFDSVKKFETTSTGISVDGNLTLNGEIYGRTSAAFPGLGGLGFYSLVPYLENANQGGLKIQVQAGGSLVDALTLDSSKNATFAGKVNILKGGSTSAQGDTDLMVQDSSAGGSTAQMQILGGATGFSNLYFSDTAAYNVAGFIYNHSSNYLATNVNGSEKMRLDASGNLGLGTSSPTDYYSGADNLVVKQASGGGGITVVTDTSSEGALYFADGTTGDEQYRGGMSYNHVSNSLVLVSSGQSQAVIDSSGNLGINESVPRTKLEIKVQTSSRTTVTRALTLNANGVGISPYEFFGTGIIFEGYDYGNLTRDYAYIDSVLETSGVGSDDFTSQLRFYTNSGGTSSTLPTQKLTITGSGNVGIGNSSPASMLQVGNGVSGTGLSTITLTGPNSAPQISTKPGFYHRSLVGLGVFSDGAISFEVNGFSGLSEAMRISSGGAVSINSSQQGYGLFTTSRLTIGNGNTGDGICVGGLLENQSAYTVQADTNTGSRFFAYIANANQSPVGTISFTSSATAYNTSSDYRLKEDLQDFKGLEMVSKIPVYDYKWKAEDSRSYGVMAHELAEVLPDAVTGDKDAEEMQGVDYSKIVPLLVKSIQELSAKLEALECQCEKK